MGQRTSFLACLIAALCAPLFGQSSGHEHHAEPEKPAASEGKSPAQEPSGHEDHEPKDDHEKLMAGPLGISRARWGSGTSWLPDSSPMSAVMTGLGDWGFMLHENIFAGYDWFDSRRGDGTFMSVNSIMGSTWTQLGPGEITFRAMLSAELLTVGARGYPLILQSGETADGEPLHDRQHPHDLFMELAGMYTIPVGDDVAFQFYVAPAGEPALGPTAFPHRPSAMSDPLAPLGHHWQDSTHISFGVVTAAVFTRTFKFDASWFNGREPDEIRYNLDVRVPDSYSGRLTWNPSDAWSLQASYGYLDSPEALEPDLSIHRLTASVMHSYRYGQAGNVATSFIFGANMPSEGPATAAFLFESTWSIDQHHDIYGRIEYVRKTAHDLALPDEFEDQAFATGMLSIGYAVHFGPFANIEPGIGVRGSVGYVDHRLQEIYGTQYPLGAMIYLQLRFGRMGH
jgi:hypothetical protein